MFGRELAVSNSCHLAENIHNLILGNNEALGKDPTSKNQLE